MKSPSPRLASPVPQISFHHFRIAYPPTSQLRPLYGLASNDSSVLSPVSVDRVGRNTPVGSIWARDHLPQSCRRASYVDASSKDFRPVGDLLKIRTAMA